MSTEPPARHLDAEPPGAGSPARRPGLRVLLGDTRAATLGLMAVRSFTIAGKFGLTLFIARELGLADLGIFGLISSAAVVLPVALGFGVSNHLGRDAVQAGPAAIAVQILQYFLCLTPLYLICGLLAAPFLAGRAPWLLVFVPLLLLEHLQTDMFALMVITGRAYSANVINFIRSAGWVLIYIPLALVTPAARSVSAVCAAWLGGCVIATLLTLLYTRDWGWGQAARQLPHRRFTLPHRHGSTALYLNDVANTLFQYVDRYIVGIFLSPTVLGVYVLFWSILNAISNLITTAIVQPRRRDLVHVAYEPKTVFDREIWRLTFTTSQIAMGMSMLAIAMIYVAAPFIGRKEIYPYLPLMFLLSAALVVRAAYEVVGIAFYAHRRDDITLYSGAAILIVAIALNLSLDPVLGIWGAGVALFSSYTIGLVSRRFVVFRGFNTRLHLVPAAGER